jgi:hypothetical protein
MFRLIYMGLRDQKPCTSLPPQEFVPEVRTIAFLARAVQTKPLSGTGPGSFSVEAHFNEMRGISEVDLECQIK